MRDRRPTTLSRHLRHHRGEVAARAIPRDREPGRIGTERRGALAFCKELWIAANESDSVSKDVLLRKIFMAKTVNAKVKADVERKFKERAVLQKHVPGVEGMMDRTGQVPVATYIVGTYNKGLPIYNGSPVQQHTIRALRTVFELTCSVAHTSSVKLRGLLRQAPRPRPEGRPPNSPLAGRRLR